MSKDATPPRKKARFDEPADAETGLFDAAEWVITNAASNLRLRLINEFSELDIDGDCVQWMKPDFVHQVFEDEKIFGYKGLAIDLTFHARTMHCLASITYSAMHVKRGKLDVAADDVRGLLKKAGFQLIEDRARFCEEVTAALAGMQTLPGAVLRSVPAADRSPAVTVRMCKTSENPLVTAWHERLQVLLLLYVDGVQLIDGTDPRWLLFAVWEGEGERSRLAAFATAYEFLHVPTHMRLRLSQIMTLPVSARRGHATTLIDVIHAYALDQGLLEVTIEEPSLYLHELRMIHHLRKLRSLGIFRGAATPPWSKALADEIRRRTMIAPPTARKLHDLERMDSLPPNDPAAYRAFRLDVKRRLYKSMEPNFRTIPESERKPQIVALLREAFGVVDGEYKEILSRLHNHHSTSTSTSTTTTTTTTTAK